jgi:hypothetical protein
MRGMNLLSGNPPTLRFAKKLLGPSTVSPMSDDEKTTAVQQPLYQNVLIENIPDLPCMSLTERGLASIQEMEKVRLLAGAYLFRTPIISYEIQARGECGG